MTGAVIIVIFLIFYLIFELLPLFAYVERFNVTRMCYVLFTISIMQQKEHKFDLKYNSIPFKEFLISPL